MNQSLLTRATTHRIAPIRQPNTNAVLTKGSACDCPISIATIIKTTASPTNPSFSFPIIRSISYYSIRKSFNIKNDKSELMKLFHKENDMQCWNCKELFSHKKVNWKPRQMALPISSGLTTKDFGIKMRNSSPNQIFGVDEYEYRGQCSKCNMEQCLFWFGEKSVKRNKKPVDVKEPFDCHECKNPIKRENQIWYSYRIQEDKKITEHLVTICPNCYTENGYPFEYNLESGIIK